MIKIEVPTVNVGILFLLIIFLKYDKNSYGNVLHSCKTVLRIGNYAWYTGGLYFTARRGLKVGVEW